MPKLKTDSLIPRLVKGLIVLMVLQVLLAVVNLVCPPDMAKADRASPVVLDRNGVFLRALPVDDGRWRLRADLNRTDPAFLHHLLGIEDARFYLHPGVDAAAVARAFLSNFHAGGIVSGGSTITMQTARLLSPHPRTYGGKAIEALRALQLELRYSKHDILQLYLTLAPYGGNLEGVRAASLSYFGHEPETLTLGEQAQLISLPQAPEARRPDLHPKAAQAARDLILDRMAQNGLIDAQALHEALQEPVAHQRLPFPAIAWQTAGRLARTVTGLQATLVTTLDAGLQTRLEAMAAATAKAQGPNVSAAILVVDIHTRGVLASVGGGGLDRPGGWIDMTRALRSPGSALKPFIYGFAFENGVVAPDTRLMDAPTRFGDYQPEDFDRNFHGEVSVKEALVNSLNVPAVAVLNRIGPDVFQARLAAVGVKLVRPKSALNDAGLALALGGEGIHLDDLAKLYAGLGDHGLVKPLVYRLDDEKASAAASGQRLMRAEAADKVLAILRETPPPPGRLPGPLMRVSRRPAYKTGTSYGYRDALAVGVAGGYAVMVWTGRPDGGARADETGRDDAAPLLFDVFDQLRAPSQVPQAIAPPVAPVALQSLNAASDHMSILFPPSGATVYVETAGRAREEHLKVTRPLKLSAHGKAPIQWYVDGAPLKADDDGAFNWSPPSEGFYDLTVTGGDGQSAKSHVRVVAIRSADAP
ncbi:penicillin-binding protein 1C [Asticcacaulis sp. EMRT-3]|uniref:penicillin-binding protein 1C n=1 Tax=Asticcacaulis sp. EMRT-3 TaxID=3040349 RepID=UPI0024AEF679|nr:penicillin-binding protein 1C [Asticcacaulis sp. EMRT-3]MDI7775935.1 penicillin-binding protein 1C [Asticcacaulis sp. EMRT-3]